jgi:metallo-beta-lactamase family protein
MPKLELHFIGATRGVTGSLHLIKVGTLKILMDCGLIQGNAKAEAANHQPFPFDPKEINAMILSHAHIDHSGRIPLLVKGGFTGPIYTHRATRDLCKIMLEDSAYIQEKDAEWDNRKRKRKGLPLVEPLYSIDDAKKALHQFKVLDYDKKRKLLPGVQLRLRDAGHILGSANIELWLEDEGVQRKIVFSGDLGHRGAAILRDPSVIKEADLVLMETTYGNRLHRPWEDTWEEIGEIAASLRNGAGNILIPAFAVGRTQSVLYTFKKHFKEWDLNRWQIFLDSPMAIRATKVYLKHTELYDEEAAKVWRNVDKEPLLPNLRYSKTSQQSMQINKIQSGAIIIAGSGMCNGGRIKHHLKHNIWRSDCHVVIVGYQAHGTTGRALVDGAKEIRLWGESIRVAAKIHTVGGLSAHADQAGLLDWYKQFQGSPPVVLIHGETTAKQTFAELVKKQTGTQATIAELGKHINLIDDKYTLLD